MNGSKIYQIVILLNILQVSYSCTKENVEHEKFVTEIRAESMIQELLPNSIIYDSKITHPFLKRYRITADSVYYTIRVGIQKDKEDAYEKVPYLLNDMEAVMTEGPYKGKIIGDKYWWHTSPYDSSILDIIIFIRYNTIFYLSSYPSNNRLEQLASNIDKSILSGSDFITLDNQLSQPVIDSIKTSNDTLKVGENSIFTVYAHDPNNAKLYYSTYLTQKSDSTFFFKAYPQFENSTQIVSFTVINEFIVVSDEKTVRITITK